MVTPNRDRLAARLQQVRAAAFPTGSALARTLGWHQTKVSKLENGRQLPSEVDVRSWVTATNAGTEVLSELLRLLSTARVEYVSHRDGVRASGGLAKMQGGIGDREARATKIFNWQPAMVPGLLQTGEYAREVLTRMREIGFLTRTDDEIEATVAARIKRQDILYQPGRHIEIIVGEAALHSGPGEADTLLGQLDRLVSLSSLRPITIGVVPFPAMPVIPLSGFELNDDVALYVETLTGEQTVYDPDEIVAYGRAFDQLRSASAIGPDAVALIQRVAAELRG